MRFAFTLSRVTTNAPPSPIDRPLWIERLFPRVAEPGIVLTWLVRLRWLAIAGQLLATAVAAVLGLSPPLAPLVAVVMVTAVTNLLILRRVRPVRPATWVVPGVILLDVGSLTLLLYYTGGPGNPFCTLYLVHVAMAVVVLGRAWTWLLVAATATAYAALFIDAVPLSPESPMSPRLHDVGAWTSLLLVGSLIAYFAGRLSRSLKEHEQEIVALRERNARNEQLATLTTLAAGAAHELGSPLATIAVAAKELELTARSTPGNEYMVEDAQLIRQEVDRCRFILDRMRVDVAADDRLNVVTHVGEMLAAVRTHLTEDERGRLKWDAMSSIDSIAASSPAVQQALVVMIRNAFDASPPGATVRMTLKRSAGTLTFEVHDTGHGMSEEVARRAGEPFFTTKEPGHGMGLGLFLVRLVAERSKGNFSLDSRPGVGTVSKLKLPLAK